MRVLLAAINARYSHTNLAVRYLKHALTAQGIDAEIGEYTINQPAREILEDLARCAPDVLLFSCYLWNIELIKRVGADFKLLFPDTPILLGGPEVSFDAEEQLGGLPWADGIIAGEGEMVIADFVSSPGPRGVRRAERFVPLDELPFVYDDLDMLQNRVLYYESSRGCPFGCAYCLSSADRQVRFRSLPLVFDDLQRFLDARVMQVKFVDRTFNIDPARANAIWRYLIKHDNGYTSFQMELGGDLLDDEAIGLLKTARPGLLQFEIGVQSTCEEALQKSCRKTDLHKLKQNVLAVKAAGNIHQHLDLIAGLPGEGFARFAQSFDEVFALRPEQLQLGFLKLLRGSTLYKKRQEYGLIHSAQPPYEILRTQQLSFADLCRIKTVEEMTEVYYNSGRFQNTLAFLLDQAPSAFVLFLRLGEGLPTGKIGKYAYYDQLFAFCISQGKETEICRWLLKYDLCLHERPRKLPECCQGLDLTRESRALLAQLDVPRSAHVEMFPFDPSVAGYPNVLTAIVFDYGMRDLSGHAVTKKIQF